MTTRRASRDHAGPPVFCGVISYFGRIPCSWQIKFISELPAIDERDELLAMLPDCRVRKDGK